MAAKSSSFEYYLNPRVSKIPILSISSVSRRRFLFLHDVDAFSEADRVADFKRNVKIDCCYIGKQNVALIDLFKNRIRKRSTGDVVLDP